MTKLLGRIVSGVLSLVCLVLAVLLSFKDSPSNKDVIDCVALSMLTILSYLQSREATR